MRGRDVICVLRYHFLVARSASFELAPGNKIIAIKDFHHNGPPKPNKRKNIEAGAAIEVRRLGEALSMVLAIGI